MISAVRRARCSGDAQIRSIAEPAALPVGERRDHVPAWRSPSSESGGSARPCQRPSAFQVDWPWRTSRSSRRHSVDGSVAGFDQLELAVAEDQRGRDGLRAAGRSPPRVGSM